ncbi:MAG: ATP-binding protein [Spirochaetales bacterium]|nr:ATP-binding protein [Spirochaetales bacterium]
MVFIELKRNQRDIYYYMTETGKEVDFLIKEGINDFSLIQVCTDPGDEKTKQREVSALVESCCELNINNGLIITENEKDNMTIDNKAITIMPCYEWLLFQQQNYG